jgi:hypothetical protein
VEVEIVWKCDVFDMRRQIKLSTFHCIELHFTWEVGEEKEEEEKKGQGGQGKNDYGK